MTIKTIEAKYGVNIIRSGNLKKNLKYRAFRGGAGSGLPVIDIAEAYTLRTLAVRIERALAKTTAGA